MAYECYGVNMHNHNRGNGMNVTKRQLQFDECLQNVFLPLEALMEDIGEKLIGNVFYEYFITSKESIRIVTKPDGAIDLVVVVENADSTRISLNSLNDMELGLSIHYAPHALTLLRSIDNGTYTQQSKNV